MIYLWQGIQLGIVLAILVGPLLVTLIQVSLEQGPRSGFLVAAGIWFSDLAFILAVYYGITYVTDFVEWPYFELTLGLVGAIVLLIVGMATLLSPPPDFDLKTEDFSKYESGISLWIKGFLINTLNPFTVFFWVSVMTSVVMEKQFNAYHSFLFFTGIMGTIVCTDAAKVILAKKIKHKLTPTHLLWVRRVAGAALVIFAFVLAARVII